MVLYWIIDIMGEGPRGKIDFDHWIQEPTVLARVTRGSSFFSLFMDQKIEVATGKPDICHLFYTTAI